MTARRRSPPSPGRRVAAQQVETTMTDSDDVALRWEALSEHAKAACSRALTLLARYRELTKAVAATEERVAETMDRMAAQWPADAGHFRVRSQQARKYAALLRQRAGQLG